MIKADYMNSFNNNKSLQIKVIIMFCFINYTVHMLFLDLTTNWTTKAQIERQLEKRHWETGTATNG